MEDPGEIVLDRGIGPAKSSKRRASNKNAKRTRGGCSDTTRQNPTLFTLSGAPRRPPNVMVARGRPPLGWKNERSLLFSARNKLWKWSHRRSTEAMILAVPAAGTSSGTSGRFDTEQTWLGKGSGSCKVRCLHVAVVMRIRDRSRVATAQEWMRVPAGSSVPAPVIAVIARRVFEMGILRYTTEWSRSRGSLPEGD